MRRPPEDALFARFRDGREPAALAKVFDLLAPDLLRIAVHLCGRVDDAEDLVQQTFLVAIERAATWNGDAGLFPWLIGILTNQARLRRRSAARAVDPARLHTVPSAPPEVAAERSELTTAIAQAVDELGDVYQPVLHLHLFHGLNAKEIGDALGRPAGSVRTQIVRGLEHLRRALPVGLGVAGVTALGTGRGLAAMRDALLARASETCALTVAGGGLATSLGGLLAMKKTTLVLSTLLAALLGTLVYWPTAASDGPTDPRPRIDDPAIARADAPNQPPDAAHVPTPVARTLAAATTAAGHLRVVVRGPIAQVVSPRESVAESGTGAPLADAIVLAWPDPAESPPRTSAPHASTPHHARTDRDGGVTLTDLAAGAWRVQARIGARAQSVVAAIAIIPGTTSEYALDVTMVGIVHGRVLDDAGLPVADAEVWAGDEINARAESPAELLRLAAVSAADGTFTAAHAQGEERLAARKAGYAASWSHPTAQLGDGEVTLVLTRGAASVAGVVVDSRDRPVAGAILGMQPGGERLHRAADGTLLAPRLPVLLRGDHEGRFAANDLAPGTYLCRVGAPGHAGTTVSFAVPAGGHHDRRIRLEPTTSLSGRVLDRQGNGLADVYVWVTAPAGGVSTVRSDAQGHFLFEQVTTPPFVVEAARGGGSSRARHAFGVADGPLTCDLVLDEPAVVATTTAPTTASTTAPPRAAITGRALGSDGHALPEAWLELIDAEGSPSVPAQVDGDGAFHLVALAAGSYTLIVGAPGRLRHRQRIELAPAQTLPLGDLALAPEASLRVRFRRPDGTPWRNRPPMPWLQDARGTWLLAGRAGGVAYTVVGDEVVVTGIPAGRYVVHGPQGDELIIEPREVVLAGGATTRIEMQVALGHYRTLHFAAPPKSDPAPTLRVEVRNGSDEVVLRTELTRGFSSRFAWTQAFVPGRYEVTARTDAGTTYRASFTVGIERTDANTVDVPIAP